MRVPQVSERIKEAPAQALRGVFAGIGQLLLITDKLRNKTPADQDFPRARASQASETVTATTAASPAAQREKAAAAAAEPAAAKPESAAVATGAAAVAPGAAAARPATPRRAPAKPATAKPATKPTAKPTTARRSPARPATAKPTAAEPAAAEPPKPPKPQSTRDFDKTGNVRLLGNEQGSSPLSAAQPASRPADSGLPLPNYDELSLASLRARLRNLDIAQLRQLADYELAHSARVDVITMFERRIAKLEAEG
jgi:hypothetical protein